MIRAATAHDAGAIAAIYNHYIVNTTISFEEAEVSAVEMAGRIGNVAAQPNDASVRLHEKLGFERVALFKEVGKKSDRWVDVGYWQLTL